MIRGGHREIQRKINTFLRANAKNEPGDLFPIVEDILRKKDRIIALAARHATPFYLIDEHGLHESVREFKTAFDAAIPGIRYFFAMKSNPHPFVLKAVIKNGMGIDVSSLRELKTAIQSGAKSIVYTGPGKTAAELETAVKLASSAEIIFNMDSFGELRKLNEITKKLRKKIKAGVRIYSKYHGKWNKFGIPLEELATFWRAASRAPYIDIQGVQIHMSWTSNYAPYEDALKDIAAHLEKNFDKKMKGCLKFIDFGGGFLPYQAGGFHPWGTPVGKCLKIIDDYNQQPSKFREKYYIRGSRPIGEFAAGIAAAIKKYLDPVVRCEYFCEPGRVICHRSMHLVMKVVDVKASDRVIMDAGINMVGWERFLEEYYPVVNLTHPSAKEITCRLYGSLCDPRDLFGEYCHASRMEEDDLVLVTNQGAYAYTLSQNFIKTIPRAFLLKKE
ncbi:MAG: alanine racemase [Patescibacteria group bacterium]